MSRLGQPGALQVRAAVMQAYRKAGDAAAVAAAAAGGEGCSQRARGSAAQQERRMACYAAWRGAGRRHRCDAAQLAADLDRISGSGKGGAVLALLCEQGVLKEKKGGKVKLGRGVREGWGEGQASYQGG
jgi:hypothetical protein